jgi:hypothetical protein
VYKFNPISDDVEVVKKNLCVSVNSGQMYEHIVGRPNFSFDFNIYFWFCWQRNKKIGSIAPIKVFLHLNYNSYAHHFTHFLQTQLLSRPVRLERSEPAPQGHQPKAMAALAFYPWKY